MSLTTRYCQLCDTPQMLSVSSGDYIGAYAQRCHHCGGLDFNTKPRPHVTKRGWDLSPADIVLLKVNRINPELPIGDGA